MAAKRKYGYYIKGNNLAIVERETSAGLGTCSLSGYANQAACENAGGTWTKGTTSTDNFGKWVSPSASIDDGLEIQYSYSPYFNLQSTGTEGSDFHRFLGWGSDGTNLLLFTFSGASSIVDLSSLFAADDWIYISGSGRWSGLHQVKSTGGSTGILTLKTKVNLRPSKISVTGTFEADDETFNGDSSAADMDIEAFKDAQAKRDTAYVFVDLAAHGSNHGLFSLSSDTTSGQLTFNTKKSIDADGDYTSTAASSVDGGGDVITIYNAFYEQISVYEGVEVLEDETFNLDLPRYLSNALVHYVRAKMFEDIMDIEKKEYFMREFKRQVEKFQSTRRVGSYRALGFGMTR